MQHMKNQPYILLVVLVVAISLLALTTCARASDELKPPVIVPISLRESGDILTKTIFVVDHHVYYFSLRFSFKENDQADRARVKGLIGGNEIDKEGKPLKPGLPTPVWLGVYAVDAGREIEVFTKEVDPILTSWGGDNFKKQIGFIELKPGKYVVRLRLLRASPEFNETPVALGIGYDKFKTNFDSKK
jgi:hypothetical protein